MQVDLLRIDADLPFPRYETEGACAFDFFVRETVSIAPKSIGFVAGNVVLKVPSGFALFILPRSSLARKKSLLIPNSPGLIDMDYCGEKDEILIQVFNFSDQSVVVERGERIAQGLFVPIEKASFAETLLPGVSRGGFGSTG